ncbi:hypothetical protein B7Y94_03760 [Candidatus Saccharibacteria bacterium 32-49-12]|nr:MAG: hypothetical protein B7Y94_03760 [Candidatus Saccharibacteria bacterium 32-49-12]
MKWLPRRWRRFLVIVAALAGLSNLIIEYTPTIYRASPAPSATIGHEELLTSAALEQLAIKGRAPKTGYSRSQFGDGWAMVDGCDTRQIILYRDMTSVELDADCRVISGVLDDPYTGQRLTYNRERSAEVQIDHVVALSDAWQKGAQLLTYEDRVRLANDPLELLAVDGFANQQKGDGDAASWLPSNKSYRCEYVSRQIAIKRKYNLWVTPAEYSSMKTVLKSCVGFMLPK